MNRILLSVVLLLPIAGYAQCSVTLGDDVVSCNGLPVSITAITNGQTGSDSLSIIYDATQGVTGLTGSAKVYFHSGIQTVPFGSWEYVVGNWGADDGVGEMTSIGSDLWKITISVPDYYGYPGGTNVIGLWMVFRNADGSATGKDDSGQDIFLETSNGNASSFGGVQGTDIPGDVGSLLWNTGSNDQTLTVTQSGSYWVTYTDGVGCVSSDTVVVQVFTGQTSVSLGPDTSLCDAASLILDAGSGFGSYEWSTSATSQMIVVDTAGDYSVTVTDQNGCIGIDLIHVDFGTSPQADFTYAPVTGLLVEFTDISSDADMVYWDLDADGTVDDSTSAGGSVQYEFGSESVFGIRMIAVNICGSDTSTQNVLVHDVGISDLQGSAGFKAYPNPASGTIYIEMEDESIEVLGTALLDLAGREVSVEIAPISKSLYIINLDRLSSGVYILQMRTDRGMIEQQIIKQQP